jgi:24-hydroxycholesterol 7alpha-hydroxylase
MLMISPYLTHRDERYFEDPEVFKPERWADGNFEKPGFVAFGGGRYQCPGRLVCCSHINHNLILAIESFQVVL